MASTTISLANAEDSYDTAIEHAKYEKDSIYSLGGKGIGMCSKGVLKQITRVQYELGCQYNQQQPIQERKQTILGFFFHLYTLLGLLGGGGGIKSKNETWERCSMFLQFVKTLKGMPPQWWCQMPAKADRLSLRGL